MNCALARELLRLQRELKRGAFRELQANGLRCGIIFIVVLLVKWAYRAVRFVFLFYVER